MLIPPEKMVFENTMNMVDYVGKGLPPTRKNYKKFVQAINYASDEEPVNPDTGQKRFVVDMPHDELVQILNQVYEDNRHNTMMTVGSFFVGVAAGMGIALKFMTPLEIHC